LSKQKGDIKERILKIAQNKSSKRKEISEKIPAQSNVAETHVDRLHSFLEQ
jgi:hypothetical protein